jgi:MoaA/NifB/PqqE/SkfB family radical SAM enzyme
MSIEELENIFKQLADGKGNFVNPDLELIYSANYNEVLLYKNFRQMLDLYRKYNFKTCILTNGVALNKEKVDLMLEYSDVVEGILLNVPSADPESWSKAVKMNKNLFFKVVDNINYALATLKELNSKQWGIVLTVNGINNKSLTKNGGWIDILENAPKINLDNKTGTLRQEVEKFKLMFPGLTVVESFHLYDRAGHLAKYSIITQENAIDKYLKKGNTRVIGCNGGINFRSRTNEWIHINPNGDLFICCADYDFETVYGNINKTPLKEIWHSKERLEMIDTSYNSMCTKCSAAIWGD